MFLFFQEASTIYKGKNPSHFLVFYKTNWKGCRTTSSYGSRTISKILEDALSWIKRVSCGCPSLRWSTRKWSNGIANIKLCDSSDFVNTCQWHGHAKTPLVHAIRNINCVVRSVATQCGDGNTTYGSNTEWRLYPVWYRAITRRFITHQHSRESTHFRPSTSIMHEMVCITVPSILCLLCTIK